MCGLHSKAPDKTECHCDLWWSNAGLQCHPKTTSKPTTLWQVDQFNLHSSCAMASTSAPLADYFWIAGIDSLSYNDPVSWPLNQKIGNGPPSPQVDATIDEGSEGETPVSPPSGTPRATARHSRNNSWNRLSKSSNEVRTSIQGLDELDQTQSNRSSITIKAPTTSGNGGGLGDFDFDKALMKFANERENFLDDLSFSAGAPVQKPPPMTIPRTDRLRTEEGNGNGAAGQVKRNPLRSVGGSIRRRISFKDMNSMKRQPSMIQRTSKWGFLRWNYKLAMMHSRQSM